MIEYQSYLEQLSITLPFNDLLYCYLVERIIFFLKVGAPDVSDKYVNLLREISNK